MNESDPFWHPENHPEYTDEFLRTGHDPEGRFELTEEARRVFAERYKDGFVKQVMLGEFDLESPLTDEEEAEYLITDDPRRRWLLGTRRKHNQGLDE